MKRKILSILLIGIIIFGLTGCGETQNNASNSEKDKTTQKQEQKEESKKEDTKTEEPAGDYVYMFNRTQRMKLGSEPSKYGEYYYTAEEAMDKYGYDMTIRHKLENGKIKSSDVGFKYDGKIYYLNGQDRTLYESNKKKLVDIFGAKNCSSGGDYYQCKTSDIFITTWESGAIDVTINNEYCYSGDDFAKCGNH